MAYLKLDYSQTDGAARRAGETADRLRRYADAINKHIGSPINGVAGGQSGHTSAVSSLASQKANKLMRKAGEYDSLKAKLEKLSRDAEAADSAVAQKFASDQKAQEQNLKWYEKIAVQFHNAINGICGESEVGRFLNTLGDMNRLVRTYEANAIKTAIDWFVHGDGKYVLNIAIAVAGAIAAVAACIGTGGIALVIGVIAAAVAIGTAAFTCIDNFTALSTSGANPGYARHMGKTDSWGSFASKHFFDKGVQQAFNIVDIVGKVASIATTANNMFKTTNPTTGKTVYDYSKQTFSDNLKAQVGLTRTSVKATPQIEEGLKNGSIVTKTVGKSKYYYEKAKVFKTIHGYKSATSFENVAKNVSRGLKDFKSMTKVLGRESNAESTIKYISKHTPVVKDFASGLWDMKDIAEYLGKTSNIYN